MNNRIDALTSTRGFAALMVVIFHFGCDIFPFSYCDRFFSGGNFAVSYFFVLSGFVMYLTYHAKEVAYKSFMGKRIARIVPLYLFALLLVAGQELYKHYTKAEALEPHFLRKLVLSITFLQAYVPGYALGLNVPGWSLSIEMFFYLLFPLLLWLQKKNEQRFVWITAVVFFVSQLVHLLLLKHYDPATPTQHDLVFYNPVLHLNEFMTGMCGGYFYFRMKESGRRFSSLPLLMLIVLMITFIPRAISIHNGLIGPLFLLFILAVAINDPRFLNLKPLIFLGEISYGIYILQLPVNILATGINGRFLHLAALPFFYFYLILLLIICSICYYAIEIPAARFINARIKKY